MSVIQAPRSSGGGLWDTLGGLAQLATMAIPGAQVAAPWIAAANTARNAANGNWAGAGMSALGMINGGAGFNANAAKGLQGVNTGAVNNAIHNTLTNNIPEMSRISDVALGTSNQIFDGGKTLGKYKLGGSWS